MTTLSDIDRERLISALRFYAKPSNWESPSTGFAAQYDPEPSPVDKDRGTMAVMALGLLESCKPRQAPPPQVEGMVEALRLVAGCGSGPCELEFHDKFVRYAMERFGWDKVHARVEAVSAWNSIAVIGIVSTFGEFDYPEFREALAYALCP